MCYKYCIWELVQIVNKLIFKTLNQYGTFVALRCVSLRVNLVKHLHTKINININPTLLTQKKAICQFALIEGRLSTQKYNRFELLLSFMVGLLPRYTTV